MYAEALNAAFFSGLFFKKIRVGGESGSTPSLFTPVHTQCDLCYPGTYSFLGKSHLCFPGGYNRWSAHRDTAMHRKRSHGPSAVRGCEP